MTLQELQIQIQNLIQNNSLDFKSLSNINFGASLVAQNIPFADQLAISSPGLSNPETGQLQLTATTDWGIVKDVGISILFEMEDQDITADLSFQLPPDIGIGFPGIDWFSLKKLALGIKSKPRIIAANPIIVPINGVIRGEIKFGGLPIPTRLEFSADSDWLLEADFEAIDFPGIGDIMSFFGNHQNSINIPDGLNNLTKISLKDISVGFNPTAGKLTSLAVAFGSSPNPGGGWEIIPGGFAIDDYKISFKILNPTDRQTRSISGQVIFDITLGGVATQLSAYYPGPGQGWILEGKTAPDQEILLGDFITKLATDFGIRDSSVPSAISGIKIDNLDIKFNTSSKDFFFTCEIKMPINGKELDAIITIDLKKQNNFYTKYISGKITIADLEFDLVFNQDETATMFLAGYENLAGGKLPITNLLKAVGVSGDALAAADKIEIDLKDALFVYDKPATLPPGDDGSGGNPPADGNGGDGAGGTGDGGNPPAAPKAKVLFGLDIGGGMNLSNLPLVGKILPKDASLRAMVQPIVTSANFSKDEVAAVKKLVPQGGIQLPDVPNGFQGRLFISGTLQVGDKKFPLGLDISKKPDGSLDGSKSDGSGGGAPAGGAPNPATAPMPPAKADNVKWFNVQKTLGPLNFKRVGFQFDKGILWFLLDASLTAAGLTVSLDGLAAGSSLKKFEPHFSLRGLGIDFKKGPLEIGGAFLRVPGQNGQPDEYDGLAIIRAATFNLSAIGSYTRRSGHASLFIYGVLDVPLGGPPFFFVTGLAAGFGYNRDLKMPPITGVAAFPLVSQAVNFPGQKKDLEEVLQSLRTYVPPNVGEIFLCAGLRFTSFEIIDSFALLAVQFGHRFEIDLLGLSTLVLPTPEEGNAVTPLAEVQMALKAVFLPEEGFLGVQAQLTNNSYVLAKACHLTGGFAFFCWFKDGYLGGHEGDFVITIGGYHPSFHKPDYYPAVPRVGFNWIISPQMSLKGGLYFALTPVAVMAGGSLQALFASGPLKAWFIIGADFLIAWKPYHYDARVYLDMGISFTFHLFGKHTITLELGADLHIWGPDFSGVAKLHILIFTVTVKFGAGANPKPQPIAWDTFRNSFLPPVKKTGSLAVQSGLVKKTTDDADDLGTINPKHFTLVSNSAVPIKSVVWNGAKSWDDDAPMPGNLDINIGSMGITDGSLQSSLTITTTLDGSAADDQFMIRPITKNAPAALWGTELSPDVNSNQTIDGVVSGFEIVPAKPPTPGHTSDIERANLRFETVPQPDAYQWAPPLPSLNTSTRDTARTEIENTISDDARVTARNALLAQLGFLGARDVDLDPGYAAGLMGNPRIVNS